jgi:hypothetical protein
MSCIEGKRWSSHVVEDWQQGSNRPVYFLYAPRSIKSFEFVLVTGSQPGRVSPIHPYI